MMHWTDHEVGWTGSVWMTAVMLLIWAGLIVVIALLVRQLVILDKRGRAEQPEPANPLALLGERLARGDIDPEDYLKRRELLSSADRDVGSEDR
jgi:putative membrane protein